MKNLTKALGIAGITALSFLPLNGYGQQDTLKYKNGYKIYQLHKNDTILEKIVNFEIDSAGNKRIKEKEEFTYYGELKIPEIIKTIFKYGDKGNLIEKRVSTKDYTQQLFMLEVFNHKTKIITTYYTNKAGIVQEKYTEEFKDSMRKKM